MPKAKVTKALRPVHSSSGFEAEFRKRLRALLEEMHASVTFWVKSAYRNNEPVIAQDAMPANELRAVLRKLSKRWLRKFDIGARKLAAYFAKGVNDRTDAQLRSILRESGISIEFSMTNAQRDILAATVNQNVALIRSIPAKYLSDVEGSVMRSVQTGRDLGQLTKDLQENYGVSYRRAAFIARDQNNKATSAFERARQIELGIDEAIWLHSHGGKVPRPTHVKMDGKRYNVKKGMWDSAEGKFVFPGELINCRCVCRSIVPGVNR